MVESINCYGIQHGMVNVATSIFLCSSDGGVACLKVKKAVGHAFPLIEYNVPATKGDSAMSVVVEG